MRNDLLWETCRRSLCRSNSVGCSSTRAKADEEGREVSLRGNVISDIRSAQGVEAYDWPRSEVPHDMSRTQFGKTDSSPRKLASRFGSQQTRAGEEYKRPTARDWKKASVYALQEFLNTVFTNGSVHISFPWSYLGVGCNVLQPPCKNYQP